jgi:hypothetical protein
MNKLLLIFLIFGILIILGSVLYTKHCRTLPDGCKNEKFDKSDFGPEKGIDW